MTIMDCKLAAVETGGYVDKKLLHHIWLADPYFRLVVRFDNCRLVAKAQDVLWIVEKMEAGGERCRDISFSATDWNYDQMSAELARRNSSRATPRRAAPLY